MAVHLDNLYDAFRKLATVRQETLFPDRRPSSRESDFTFTFVMEQNGIKRNVAWNSDTTYALGFYKYITNILGIWPVGSQDVCLKFRIVTVAILQLTMAISLIAEMRSECSSVQDAVEMISLFQCTILSLVKVIALHIFRPKMLELISSAVNDWASLKSSRVRDVMRKYAKTGRFVCIFQMTSAYITTVPLIIGALPFLAPGVNGTNGTEIPRGLPLPTICIFSDTSDISYAIIFIIQAIQLLTTCTANIGNDTYFFGIAMHLCGQFQLLGEDLENIDIKPEEGNEQERLIAIIRKHVRLRALAQYLEDSFNFIILVQLSANAIQMCLMGIQMILSLKSGNTIAVINTIVILYVLSLQLYLYSYAGDCLTSQIAQFGVSAYFSPWYTMPPKQARDVLFMIMRHHKNFNITAGKVYTIDIDNFKNLIKGLGSYFSVLRIMFDT